MGFSIDGAASGASMGSAAGPYGAIAGGIIGGLFGGKKKKEAPEKEAPSYASQFAPPAYAQSLAPQQAQAPAPVQPPAPAQAQTESKETLIFDAGVNVGKKLATDEFVKKQSYFENLREEQSLHK